ncbi:MAG: hypothetical protein ACTSYX_05635 [Candidatus Thorarchaeota archaeon]
MKTVEAPPEMHGLIETIEAKLFIGLRAIGINLKDELDSVLGEDGRNLLIYRLGQSFG